MRRIGDRMMFGCGSGGAGPARRSRLMGWTLGRYFFFRYAAITAWFFVGIFALVFADRLHRILEPHGRPARASPSQLALAVSALRVPHDHAAGRAVRGAVRGDGDAGLAQPANTNSSSRASAGISAWQFLLPCLPRRLPLRRADGRRPQSAGGARLLAVRRSLETQLPVGQVERGLGLLGAPWLRQKTAEGDTIIGARAVLNQGLELADAVFFSLDAEGNIVRAPRRCARLSCATATGSCTTSAASATARRSSRSRKTAVPTNLKPEFVQERLARPGNDPVLRTARQDRGGALVRAAAQRLRHAVPLAAGAAGAARRHDADRGDRLDALCADGPVRDDDSGWRGGRLSALCGVGSGESIRECGIRTAYRGGLVTGGRGDVFRGDVPAVQGGRLVGVAARWKPQMAGVARLLGATALACLARRIALSPAPSSRRTIGDLAGERPPTAAQMLLEADTLIYDNDDETVTAAGSVQIDYGGNQLVAKRSSTTASTAPADRQRQRADRRPQRHQGLFRRDRRHRRLRRRLRQRAARRDRRQDLFRRRERGAPRRLPDHLQQRRLHRLRALRGQAGQGADLAHQGASKIIWNGKAKTVRFENSRFEFFGFPIAQRARTSRSPTRR